MSRSRLVIVTLLLLVTLVLSRGVMRVRAWDPHWTPPSHADPQGRSAQAARTDPSLLSRKSPPAPAAGEIEVIRQTIRDAGTTVYLPTMFAETDSAIRRWSDSDAQSLQVAYIVGDTPAWSPEDLEIARGAFHAWEQVGLPLHFVEVLDTAGAAIIVRWVPHFPIDRTGQTDLTWDELGRIHHATIQLALEDSGGRPISGTGLRAVALHEVGHALGLPHSGQEADLMFPTTRRPVMTDRDLATIRLLYTLPPISIK
jgi:hypothetical protein